MKPRSLLIALFFATTAVLAALSSTLITTATSPFQQWDGTPAFLPYIVKAPPTPTPTPTPTASPTPTATPSPTSSPTPIPLPGGANQICSTNGATEICAWVSNGTPAKNSTVVVYGSLRINGQPVAGQAMASTWYYKTTTVTCSTSSTGADGIASCSRGIGNASSGYKVNVVVNIGGNQVTTWFIPN